MKRRAILSGVLGMALACRLVVDDCDVYENVIGETHTMRHCTLDGRALRDGEHHRGARRPR